VRSCWCRGAAGVKKELLLLLWLEERASYYWNSKLLLMVGTKSFYDWEENSYCWKEDEASAGGLTVIWGADCNRYWEETTVVAEQKTGVCRQLMKTKILLMLCSEDKVIMVVLVQSCSSVMIQQKPWTTENVSCCTAERDDCNATLLLLLKH
jgi:hypothetical protein